MNVNEKPLHNVIYKTFYVLFMETFRRFRNIFEDTTIVHVQYCHCSSFFSDMVLDGWFLVKFGQVYMIVQYQVK